MSRYDPHRLANFWAQAIRAKVPELVALGASIVREEHYEALGHVVMLDPEGNEFCVA